MVLDETETGQGSACFGDAGVAKEGKKKVPSKTSAWIQLWAIKAFWRQNTAASSAPQEGLSDGELVDEESTETGPSGY